MALKAVYFLASAEFRGTISVVIVEKIRKMTLGNSLYLRKILRYVCSIF